MTQADRLVGGPEAYLVIDDTALPKKGRHSGGVAPQYASALGKNANCQTLVSVTFATGEVPVSVSLCLFLPESWTGGAGCLDKAGVPHGYQAFQSKPEIALSEIDRMIAAGMRFSCVLANAAFGLSARFCPGPERPGLAWAVSIPRHQKVYPADVALIFPVAGGPRKRHLPDQLSVAAAAMLAKADWRTVSWRRGTKGKLSARFTALQVRVADGPSQRIGNKGAQHIPGEVVWLVGEHRASGERKYYLSTLPADTDLTALAATIKARWVCEQAHQQLKEELSRPRPLRRLLLDRPAPPRADDADGVRVPAAPASRGRGSGKKRRPTAASAKPA